MKDNTQLEALRSVQPTAGGEPIKAPPTDGFDWTPPAPEEVNRLLPQYRIERLLGQGGMGAVYKGYQPALDRPVAIKLLRVEAAEDAGFVAQFKHEARTLAKLHHSRIITIHDLGQSDEGHLYFVMEFVDGSNLRTILAESGLAAEHTLLLVCQVCDALEAAHQQEILHRDIKPENILLTKDGYVKLIDFGLASPARDPRAGGKEGVVFGTPDYAAPEVPGGHGDHRSDIYALGVVLYEMLTGSVPDEKNEPASLRANTDPRLDHVINRATHVNPDERYQRASDFKAALERVRTTPPAAAPRVVPLATPRAVPKSVPVQVARPRAVAPVFKKPPRSPLKTFLFIAMDVVLIVFSAWWVWTRFHPAPAKQPPVPAQRKDLAAKQQPGESATVPPPLAAVQERKYTQRVEGESMSVARLTRGEVESQDMSLTRTAEWSNGMQLHWVNAGLGDTLQVRFAANEAGRQRIKGAMSGAADFAVVAVAIDGKPANGSPFDMQADHTVISGILDWGVFDLTAGEHVLEFKTVATHGIDNREKGIFGVGLDYIVLEPPVLNVEAAAPGSNVALSAKPSSSFGNLGTNDHVKWLNAKTGPPATSGDRAYERQTWYPHRGSAEWVQYDWTSPQVINACRVFWFDDLTRTAGSTLPVFWRILYRDESGAWVPVNTKIPPAERDKFNVVKFPAVRTSAIRILAQCAAKYSGGIWRWECIAADPAEVSDSNQRALSDLSLTDLSPLRSRAEPASFRINVYGSDDWEVRVGGKICSRFLMAHAPSRVEYAIPAGYTRFRATAVGPYDPKLNKPAAGAGAYVYKVQVDDNVVFESKELMTYPNSEFAMEMKFPAGSKRLTLITESGPDNRWDHAFWANPTLQAGDGASAEPEDLSAPPTDVGTPQKLVPRTINEPDFTPILDATHRAGWKHLGPGEMKESNGVFSTSTPMGQAQWGLYWYTIRPYGDFMLRCDFAVDSTMSNSGIYFRIPSMDRQQPGLFIPGAYEVEISGAQTGTLYNVRGNLRTLKVREWNECEITAIGSELIVKINGVETSRVTNAAIAMGHIGLQNLAAEGEVHFSNVRIRDLSKKTAVQEPITPPDIRIARQAFEASIRGATAQLRSQIDSIASLLGRTDKALVGHARTIVAKALRDEAEAFEKSGEIPLSRRARPATAICIGEIRKAWDKWAAACNEARDFAKRAGNEPLAEQFEAVKMVPMRACARWESHGASMGTQGMIWAERFYPNGMLTDDQGTLKGWWRIDGDKIAIANTAEAYDPIVRNLREDGGFFDGRDPRNNFHFVSERRSVASIPRASMETPRFPPPPLPAADAPETAAIRDALYSYNWSYKAPGFTPIAVRFGANGVFNPTLRWRFWIASPNTIRVQFSDKEYDPETAFTFTFNPELTAFTCPTRGGAPIVGQRLGPVVR